MSLSLTIVYSLLGSTMNLQNSNYTFIVLKLPLIFATAHLFIYLGFYIAFNTVQVISRRVVGRAEETSTYSLSGFCTVKCRPRASNYQLSHLRTCPELNPGLRSGRRECYHHDPTATVQDNQLNSVSKKKTGVKHHRKSQGMIKN